MLCVVDSSHPTPITSTKREFERKKNTTFKITVCIVNFVPFWLFFCDFISVLKMVSLFHSFKKVHVNESKTKKKIKKKL